MEFDAKDFTGGTLGVWTPMHCRNSHVLHPARNGAMVAFRRKISSNLKSECADAPAQMGLKRIYSLPINFRVRIMKGTDLGFLGFGKMAQSIAAGISDMGFKMHYFDAAPGSADLHSRAKSMNVDRSPTARELETSSDILLICVKPQDLHSALSPLEGNKDYISIAAGVSVGEIISYLPNQQARVARVMPNLGATINQSVSGIYCPEPNLLESALHLFSGIGMAFAVAREDLLHGVTALSGSGPAYAFLFLQSMGEAGIKQGLPAEQSFEMAARTIRAAMDLYLESGEHPAQWITRVSSPGGTTIEGLAALEDHGVRGAVIRAVEAAADRSRELGRKES